MEMRIKYNSKYSSLVLSLMYRYLCAMTLPPRNLDVDHVLENVGIVLSTLSRAVDHLCKEYRYTKLSRVVVEVERR